MKRRLLYACCVLLLAAGALLALRRGKSLSPEVLRDAPAVPHPKSDQERAAFFFDLFRSGAAADLGVRRLEAWRLVGEDALQQLGAAAADYLVAKERIPEYRRDPALLQNVMRLLSLMPDAGRSKRLYPFLLYWLDAAHCPPVAPGANWVYEFRRWILAIFAQHPDPRALGVCRLALEKHDSEHDLRSKALALMVRIGAADALQRVYPSLPPDSKEPHVGLKAFLLDRLREASLPGASPESRKTAERLIPLLKKAVESALPQERIPAETALLALGHKEMRLRLIQEFETGRHSSNALQRGTAWLALQRLAETTRDSYARDTFLETLRHPDADGTDQVGYRTSVVQLSRSWPDDPEVAAELLKLLRKQATPDPFLLAAVAHSHRQEVGALLHQMLESHDRNRQQAAAMFARRLSFDEAGPWILDLVRRTRDPKTKMAYVSTLAALQTPGAAPVLSAELVDSAPASVRRAAAEALLALRAPEGLEKIASRLREGDDALLKELLLRAVQGAGRSLPDALVPALVDRLRNAKGEQDRLTALFILRCRGTLRGVEAGLVAAYRTEPSEKVAREIRLVLRELAYRKAG